MFFISVVYQHALSISSDAANKSAVNASSVRNISYTYNTQTNYVSGYTPGATPQVVSDFNIYGVK